MWVEFGNENAQEGYRDPKADDPDEVKYRPLDGQRVTTLTFPDEMGLQEAFTTAVGQVQYHFANDGDDATTGPSWVDSDNEAMKTLLDEQFGTKGKARPKTWGKEFGLHENESLPSVQASIAASTSKGDDK